MKAIHAEPKSFDEIFKSHEFVIPEYQRPYSWGLEHCDKLWDDISSFYHESSEKEIYFLGSIVVHPLVEDENPGAETWCVIDGQQRLTTLLILVKILFEKAMTMEVLQKYLFKADMKTDAVLDGKPRLVTRVHVGAGRNDPQDLNSVICGRGPFSSDTSPFVVNYHHLQKKVDGWAQGKSPEQIEKFIQTLRFRIRLLPLVCSELDDALELFQIINDRGMHLGDADIFKAKIYSAVEEENKDSFINRWGSLSDHDSLFRAFMHISRAKEGDTTKEIALRKYVNDNHLNKKNDLEKEWESILRCLEVCSWIGQNDDVCAAAMHSDAKIYWHILSWYPNVYWQYPLYVLAHKHVKGENGGFSLPENMQKEYIALLKESVRYFYIKGVVYNSVNAVKDTAYKVCAAIEKGDDYAAVYQKNIDEHGDMQEFYRKLTECDYGRCQRGLVLLNSLPTAQGRAAYAEVLSGTYHIEHILPRKWNDYDRWDADSHKRDIDKIGNLMPLEWKLNIAASNEFFPRKQEKYGKSDVPDAGELSKKTPAQWYPEDVDARHKESHARLRKFFDTTG